MGYLMTKHIRVKKIEENEWAEHTSCIYQKKISLMGFLEKA
jgi:hypothetical protein